jgi:glutamine cyclotransferase
MKQLKKLNKYILPTLLLCTTAACNNSAETAQSTATTTETAAAASVPIPTVISYDIINTYPHDPKAFTEGLEFYDGFLYEGTGNYGESDLRKVNLQTGEVLLSKKLDRKYFGEGITILNGKIYQLTYREGKGFVYDLATLKEEKSFIFNAAEGWGMLNNGTNLIYDDGTNVLHFLDPETFKEVKTLAVKDEHGPLNNLNEPEFIKGYLYANQWLTDIILKIDTATGYVVGRADLTSIRERLGIPPVTNRRNSPDVMNGIAYDAKTNRIFITGKNWPKLIEVKLDN